MGLPITGLLTHLQLKPARKIGTRSLKSMPQSIRSLILQSIHHRSTRKNSARDL